MTNSKKNESSRGESILCLLFVIGWLCLSFHMSDEVPKPSFAKSSEESECGYHVIVYDNGPQFENELEEALSNLEPEVAVIGTTVDFNDFRNLAYSSFWMTGFSTYSEEVRDPVSDEPVLATVYRFTYEVTSKEEVERRKAEVDDAIDSIICEIPYEADEETAIMIVHDELCNVLSYETTRSHQHIRDAYGLVNGEAVCSGYAADFNEAMRRLRITSEIIFSETHAWNRVWLGSGVYDIDVTWDDPDENDEYGDPVINYTYYMLSPELMASFPDHQSVEQTYY